MAKEISKNDLAARKARKAQREMLAYMEENNLDPKKDWTDHKNMVRKFRPGLTSLILGIKRLVNSMRRKQLREVKKEE